MGTAEGPGAGTGSLLLHPASPLPHRVPRYEKFPGRMHRESDPTDLTEAQWEVVCAAMPPARNGRTGTPRRYPLRDIWNAVFYQAGTGCAWRALPPRFPPWPAVWQQYKRWKDNGTLEAVRAALQGAERRQEPRGAAADVTHRESPWARLDELEALVGFLRGGNDPPPRGTASPRSPSGDRGGHPRPRAPELATPAHRRRSRGP